MRVINALLFYLMPGIFMFLSGKDQKIEVSPYLPAIESQLTAIPMQVEGLYIFIYSRPQAEFKYLATVKSGITWNGQPNQLISSIIKKTKVEYPNAKGLIFSEDLKKADVIIF